MNKLNVTAIIITLIITAGAQPLMHKLTTRGKPVRVKVIKTLPPDQTLCGLPSVIIESEEGFRRTICEAYDEGDVFTRRSWW